MDDPFQDILRAGARVCGAFRDACCATWAMAWRLWQRALSWCLRRMGVRDESYSQALTRSFTAHFLIIVLTGVPTFLEYFGCIEPYLLPAGKPMKKTQVHRVRIRKKKKLVINPNAPVAFNIPKAEQIDIGLDELTENARAGAGEGAGGYGGSKYGKVRFIRLEYRGDWNQDMDENAGSNMLREFGRRRGARVAREEESLRIRLLKKFPPKQSPPFVYMTGSHGFNLSDGDLKTLREYIVGRGGMIFGDCGGPQGFHHSFIRAMQRVVPRGRWVTIPRDDPIYQQPYLLNGSPPLWHHGGYDALGIKHNGRWAVFYHPGDIGDAWKTGHGGTSRSSWEAAYALGVNVIEYAILRYQEFHGGE